MTRDAILVGVLHQFVIAVRAVPVWIVTTRTSRLTRLETAAHEKRRRLVAETSRPPIHPPTWVDRVVFFEVHQRWRVMIKVRLAHVEAGSHNRLCPVTLAAAY